MTWTLPDPTEMPQRAAHGLSAPVGDLSQRLSAMLDDLNVSAQVVKALAGPSTIRFEIQPGTGVRMRDFTRLQRDKDLAAALRAERVTILAPIPGTDRVGVEIPNPAPEIVNLAAVTGMAGAPLTAALGVTSEGKPIGLDLASLPHLAVAGASGSGKSSLLHSIICSLLTCCTPDDLQLVLVDCKRVELTQYNGLPHLPVPVITDADAAVGALQALVGDVERRYRLLEKHSVQNIDDYNIGVGAPDGWLPRVLVVVDEFGDLMLQAHADVEKAVVRLGQLGRACGVHLILATQSPHQQILSGLIKANVPARIALRVASATHSRVAIDTGGAELLNGHGDALLADGRTFGTTRFQSAYVPRDVIRWVVDHWTAASPVTVQRAEPTVAPARTVPAPARRHVAPPVVKFTVRPTAGAWTCRTVTT